MKQILKKNKREKKNLKPKLGFLISYLLLLCTQKNSVTLHPLTHITLHIEKNEFEKKNECWTQNFDCRNAYLIKIKKTQRE